ncbi:MAG: amidohydrolase family protein, partial [Acidimicrobiales bacterium]
MGEPAAGDLIVRRVARVFGHPRGGDGPLAVVVRNGRVAAVVPEGELARAAGQMGEVAELDAAGRAVIPGFVDAHTHLVFAGSRSMEFKARLEGRGYAAGGIMATVAATRAAGLPELADGVVARAEQALDAGTTTMEVKSG